MATELLTIASGAATSADVTLDGSTLVFLKATGGVIPYGAEVALEVKDSAGGYTAVGKFNAGMISGAPAAGTYRLRRIANGASVGAEKAA